MKSLSSAVLITLTLLSSAAVAHADARRVHTRFEVGNGPGGNLSLAGAYDLAPWATAELSYGLGWFSDQLGVGIRLGAAPVEGALRAPGRHRLYLEPAYALNRATARYSHLATVMFGYEFRSSFGLSFNVGLGTQVVVGASARGDQRAPSSNSIGELLVEPILEVLHNPPYDPGDVLIAARLGLGWSF